MDTKKIFSSLLLFAGVVLIIICFLHFGRNMEAKILTLNIIVSSFIFSLLFADIFFPMVDLKNKSHKTVGSLGAKWFFRLLYILVAIGSMILFNIDKPVNFNSQLIFQGVFLFLLFLGLYFAYSSSTKVNEVYMEEVQARSRVDDMKKATKEVNLRLEQLKNIQPDIHDRVSALHENIRYLSTCNNQDAFVLEENFLKEMKAVYDLLYGPVDEDKIRENIKNCEVTFRERKQIYSN